MSLNALGKQLRTCLEQLEPTNLPDLINLTDDFVLECSTSPETDQLVAQCEEQLQVIYDELVDHSSLHQSEVFLAVLRHLEPILSALSIISSWFDLILRPSLREPRLPSTTVNYAREIILSSLRDANGDDLTKVFQFRRRLMDLYLLDALNESSGDEMLEWAQLDEEEREKRNIWKTNLTSILLQFGTENPRDFMSEVQEHFIVPSSRLQLLVLLNSYVSEPFFKPAVLILAEHPLMSSLLSSLLLDDSSTVCTLGLTVMVKLLPLLAVHAGQELLFNLPQLLAVLGRVICWKQRTYSVNDVDKDGGLDQELYEESKSVLHLRSDLGWNRLDVSFQSTSNPPTARTYFTMLYYLFPCNILRWMRDPVKHLTDCKMESPYTIGWSEAFDEGEIRSKSERLLRSHVCHPLIIYRNSEAELAAPDFWVVHTASQIASEASLLDVRVASLAIRERARATNQATSRAPSISESPTEPSSHIGLTNVDSSASSVPQISLEEMVKASVLLKSGFDLDIVNPSSNWQTSLIPSIEASPAQINVPLPSISKEEASADDDAMRVAQTVSSLQREVLLLRNELNVELWMSRENAKHIGRLYKDRVISKNAESERQGLYNKLRKYRSQVMELERELREQKELALSAKNKYADWNRELSEKLRDFREEKKNWISETTVLRTSEKEAKAHSVAKSKLLESASTQVSTLETQKKENQHKIDRLRDYERQIEEYVKNARAWEEDFAKFKDRGAQIESMQSQYRQMQMRVESAENSMSTLQDLSRIQRREIQSLKAQLAQAQSQQANASIRQQYAEKLQHFAVEKDGLLKDSVTLRDENADLQDTVEELRAMVEYLKAQSSGQMGVVSSRRTSPVTATNASPL